ncbi:MAG: hypothetical protein Q7S42_02160, partial [Candidatus Omnitrophota bacterium]|nr:hypothetical protein [Candidatus Omnitrophota bacterium]
NQMILMNLADCMMVVYVLESVLAALAKNRTDMNLLLARLVFSDNLFILDKATKELLGMCSEGDDLKKRLLMMNLLTGTTPENVKELCNKISENLLR